MCVTILPNMTYTITVEMTVFTDDKNVAIENAKTMLPDILDGSDFTCIDVISARKDITV